MLTKHIHTQTLLKFKNGKHKSHLAFSQDQVDQYFADMETYVMYGIPVAEYFIEEGFDNGTEELPVIIIALMDYDNPHIDTTTTYTVSLGKEHIEEFLDNALKYLQIENIDDVFDDQIKRLNTVIEKMGQYKLNHLK